MAEDDGDVASRGRGDHPIQLQTALQRGGHLPHHPQTPEIYKVIPELLTPFNSEHVTICKNISITRII